MSQVFLGVSATPSVPTNFSADTGSAVPVLNTLNILGDDSTEDNINGITTSAAGDTLTTLLTNRLYGTGSTVGTLTDDVITFALGASVAGYAMWFEMIGRDTTSGDLFRYTLRSTFKTDGAAATRVNTPFSDKDEDSLIGDDPVTIVASGNDAIVRVTGAAGSTILWSCVGLYLKV